MVLVGGRQYYTAHHYTPGRQGTWYGSGSALGVDESGNFKVNACSRRILIMETTWAAGEGTLSQLGLPKCHNHLLQDALHPQQA